MKKLYKKYKKYLDFVVSVILLGVLVGIIYYYFIPNDSKDVIVSTLTNYKEFKYNFIFKDLMIMSLMLVLSFFVVGGIFGIIYLFYEGFTLGFLINVFFSSFGIKGFIYSLIFIILNKLLVIFLKIIYLKKNINLSRYIIGLVIYKEDSIKNKLIFNIRSSLYIILFVLIINVILYFLSPYILKKFIFLL